MTPEERADPVARLVEDVGVYDSELGWVVCADDIGRLLGEAVQALEEAAKIYDLAQTVAEWHVMDGDECGVIARELIARLEIIKK